MMMMMMCVFVLAFGPFELVWIKTSELWFWSVTPRWFRFASQPTRPKTGDVRLFCREEPSERLQVFFEFTSCQSCLQKIEQCIYKMRVWSVPSCTSARQWVRWTHSAKHSSDSVASTQSSAADGSKMAPPLPATAIDYIYLYLIDNLYVIDLKKKFCYDWSSICQSSDS